MGKRRSDKTITFLNNYDYRRTHSVTKAIRALLRLESSAEASWNEGIMILLADIKSGLYDQSARILSEGQKKAIDYCLVNDLSTIEAGQKMNMTPEMVGRLVKSGVKRIRDYLISGEMGRQQFSEAEEASLTELYYKGYYNVDIAAVLGKSPRQIKYKIRNMVNNGKLMKLEQRGLKRDPEGGE